MFLYLQVSKFNLNANKHNDDYIKKMCKLFNIFKFPIVTLIGKKNKLS